MKDINIRLTDEQIKLVLAASARKRTARGATIHRHRKRDTLWGIAEAQYGKGHGPDHQIIFEANNPPLTNPNIIHPSQVLKIPPLP